MHILTVNLEVGFMKEQYTALEVVLVRIAPMDVIASSPDYELPAIPYGLNDNFGAY